MMLTEDEKNEFIKMIPALTTRIFQSSQDSEVIYKVLVNFIEKTQLNKLQFSSIIDSNWKNKDLIKSSSEIFKYIAHIASEEPAFAPSYTTGQLANYFGVSITTINNWIKEGRFIGVERSEKNAHARISANTYWKSKSGELHVVSDIIIDWEEENKSLEINLTATSEISFLVNQMALYQAKHGGDIEQTLGSKSIDQLESEEETDLATWKYLWKRFKKLNEGL